MACSWCRSNFQKKYVVAERTDNTVGNWFFIDGPYCKDCARANMKKRAQDGKIVAVFPNEIKTLYEDRYRYFIDLRDKPGLADFS